MPETTKSNTKSPGISKLLRKTFSFLIIFVFIIIKLNFVFSLFLNSRLNFCCTDLIPYPVSITTDPNPILVFFSSTTTTATCPECLAWTQIVLQQQITIIRQSLSPDIGICFHEAGEVSSQYFYHIIGSFTINALEPNKFLNIVWTPLLHAAVFPGKILLSAELLY